MSEKNKSQRLFVMIILAVLVAVGLVRHFHIKNFQTVVPEVLYTSGQPRGMDYTRLLYKYHIGTIVNVRLPSEHRERNWYNEEITWVRENGVNYIELPIAKGGDTQGLPDERVQAAFLEIMSDVKNLPVLVHGSSGRKRESILAAVWLIRSEGYSLERAVEVVERIEGRSITEAQRAFLADL